MSHMQAERFDYARRLFFKLTRHWLEYVLGKKPAFCRKLRYLIITFAYVLCRNIASNTVFLRNFFNNRIPVLFFKKLYYIVCYIVYRMNRA